MQDAMTRLRPAGAASATLCLARLRDISMMAACSLLSPAELDRARRIRHREAWLQFVGARALLRLVLGRCTGQAPRTLALADAEGDAPRLVDNPWGLHFSVSHSHETAAVAVAGSPIGVDIERVDATCNWAPIAHLCFHAREQERLAQAPEVERMAMFFDLWTRKEAYLKGLGIGLSQDPSCFSIGAHDGAVVRDGPAAAGPLWYTRAVAAPAGYVAALASHDPRLAVTSVTAATLLESLCAATQRDWRLGMGRAALGIQGTNPEWRVKYRAQHRFAPADVRCRFGTVEGTR